MDKIIQQDEDIDVEDGESYNFGSKAVDYKTLVMRQFQKCCDECNKELTKKGVINRVIHGEVYQFPVPDQSDIIINCIDVLKIILQPKIEKNYDSVKKYFDSFDSEYKKLQEYLESSSKDIELKYPAKDTSDAKAYNYTATQRNQAISTLDNTYESRLVLLYKNKILLGISFLLDKLNYLSEFRDSQ